jgi:hypothetical protein
VHTSRNIIFNEVELAENISVKGFLQNIIASTNTTITSIFAENKENKENKFIAAKIRKTTFKIKLPKKVVEIIEISAKFINIIVLRRNPNIVYENFIKENLILPKVMTVKIISNKDKPSYEIAIANPEIS